jgi:uncharacterized membrane protein YdbT with pleckstrin-like domain
VAFSQKLLNEGEDVVLDLHPHWFFFVQPLAALIAATVFGGYVLSRGNPPAAIEGLAGILVLVSLAWFGITYAKWATTNFVITTDRLIYRHGVLAKHGIEIPLERVNTVFFSQSIFERMLGSGDLVIESAGEMGRQAFSNVRKPSAVQNEIYRQMEANENRKYDRIAPGAPSAARADDSIPAQIEQLDELRQRGLLTEAEFQAKKAELLRRM